MTVKEISFSGIADTTILPILLQNITQDTSDASVPDNDDLYDILNNYEPASIILDGTETSTSYADKTLTVVIENPATGYSMVFKGCVLTSLTINGDIGEESGRIKMSGTFKSGMVPDLSPSSAPTFGTTAHFNNNYFITDFDTTKVAGVTDYCIKIIQLNIRERCSIYGF